MNYYLNSTDHVVLLVFVSVHLLKTLFFRCRLYFRQLYGKLEGKNLEFSRFFKFFLRFSEKESFGEYGNGNLLMISHDVKSGLSGNCVLPWRWNKKLGDRYGNAKLLLSRF